MNKNTAARPQHTAWIRLTSRKGWGFDCDWCGLRFQPKGWYKTEVQAAKDAHRAEHEAAERAEARSAR